MENIKNVYCLINHTYFIEGTDYGAWLSDEATSLIRAEASTDLTEEQEADFDEWLDEIHNFMRAGFELKIDAMIQRLHSQGVQAFAGDEQELNRLARGNGVRFDEVFDGSDENDPVSLAVLDGFPAEHEAKEPAIPSSLLTLVKEG